MKGFLASLLSKCPGVLLIARAKEQYEHQNKGEGWKVGIEP
jgi:hypothetical protein